MKHWLEDRLYEIEHAEKNKFENYLKLELIKQYLDIMKSDPDGHIKKIELYHTLRRILGDV